jgi:hypothetical protein
MYFFSEIPEQITKKCVNLVKWAKYSITSLAGVAAGVFSPAKLQFFNEIPEIIQTNAQIC